MINFTFAVIFAIVVSYLLGSCNSALITVRLMKGVDIRDYGSGNAGLTNTLRCFGKLPALITLIGDLSKGVIAVFLSRLICHLLDAGIGTDFSYIGYIAGFFAVLGHIFPIYYGFKGGKGVLVGVSLFLVLDPISFCVLILIFAVVLYISKYVSLSSIIAASMAPVATFLMRYFCEHRTLSISLIHTVLTIPIALTVIYMHKSNIERLRNGTENKFTFGKKE